MSGGIVVLLVIVIVIGSMLDSARKMGQGTGAPRSGRSRLPPLPPRAAPPGAGRDRADALVPDDLWAILTGERRVPPAPSQRPEPVAVPHERAAGGFSFEAVQAPEAEWSAEAEPAATSAGPPMPAALAGGGGARAPLAAVPVATGATAPTAPGPASETTSATALLGTLTGHDSLRRAVVLQVVLGPPKSLE